MPAATAHRRAATMPIYRLARRAQASSQFDFPPRLNPITRATFERLAEAESAAHRRGDQGVAGRHHRSPQRSRRCRPTRTTTRRCAPPASRRCLRPATAENALAADRARHRELPHPARRADRRHRRYRSLARSATRRSTSRRKGRADDELALAAAPGGDAGGIAACHGAVAGRAGAGHHVGRLHRQSLAAQCRHPSLRVSGLFSDQGRKGCTAATSASRRKMSIPARCFFIGW